MTNRWKTAGSGLAALTLALGLTACNDDKSDGSVDEGADTAGDTATGVEAALESLDAAPYGATMSMDLGGLQYLEGLLEFDDDENGHLETLTYSSVLKELAPEAFEGQTDDEKAKVMVDTLMTDMVAKTTTVGGEAYHQMKGGMGAILKPKLGEDFWVHMPADQVDAGMERLAYQPVDIDVNAEMILGNITDVEETEAKTFEGSLETGAVDLVKLFGLYGPQTVGEESIPVTVTMDDEGRFSGLSFSATAVYDDLGEYPVEYAIDIAEWDGDYSPTAPEGNIIEVEELDELLLDE
ncbi:hypothetical protein [Salininema proteolyticum]|uniref:Lipoprotein n=1 Tax=Salininema proteolyticum TaxID=1607685 RepID=A0ABV8TWQ6_9ACTN